jgi:hypothetical protein
VLEAATRATSSTESVSDIHAQVRKNTDINRVLRSPLNDQLDTIVTVQAKHQRLRNETKTRISNPSLTRCPSRKQTAL